MSQKHYDPRDFDCVLVAELNGNSGGYEWELLAVWKHPPTGKLYWYYGSGCSCNGAYDDVSSVDHLEVLTKGNYSDVKAKAEHVYEVDATERLEFLKAVDQALYGGATHA